MISLDAEIRIPGNVLFTTIDESAVLLNVQNNKYYSLDDVGAHFWRLVYEGKQLREAFEVLLTEYQVARSQLEKDILELLQQLISSNLIEIVS